MSKNRPTPNSEKKVDFHSSPRTAIFTLPEIFSHMFGFIIPTIALDFLENFSTPGHIHTPVYPAFVLNWEFSVVYENFLISIQISQRDFHSIIKLCKKPKKNCEKYFN